MNLLTTLETIEQDITTGWDDIKAFFSRLSSEETTLISTVDAIIAKVQAILNSPGVITIASLIPDGIGTEVETILNTVLADILAGLTYLQGLTTTTGASASDVLAGNKAGALANPDAVAAASLSLVANATPTQQASFLNSFGNEVLAKIAPTGTNLTIAKINLARALKTQVAA
jgi:hypothetical protein